MKTHLVVECESGPHRVVADVVDGLAIHRFITDDWRPRDGFVVSHVVSSLALPHQHLGRELAEAYRAELLPLTDWTEDQQRVVATVTRDDTKAAYKRAVRVVETRKRAKLSPVCRESLEAAETFLEELAR